MAFSLPISATASVPTPPPRQYTPSPIPLEALEHRRLRLEDIPAMMPIESVVFGKNHWQAQGFEQEFHNLVGRYHVLRPKHSHPYWQEAASATLPPVPEVLGYSGTWLLGDEAHITTLAVHPEWQGKKLGAILLAHVIALCYDNSVHEASLEMRASNHNAEALYTSFGFQRAGLRPKYYQDNQEDALILTTYPALPSECYRNTYWHGIQACYLL
ncbi:MAG: ribosomal protein S18-alanine N-acetyltransferase [Vampirovibrionales bacterium]